jgi:hypothetical protein
MIEINVHRDLDRAMTAERRYDCLGYSATMQLKRNAGFATQRKARIARRNETGRYRGRDLNDGSKVAGGYKNALPPLPLSVDQTSLRQSSP